MALDQRVIMFPPVVLLTAMRLRAAQASNPLPHNVPEKVIFDPSKDVALAIRFSPASDGDGEPRDFRFSRVEVFQALLYYCKQHDFPIPREGIKRLDEINGRAALMIHMGQTNSHTSAQSTGRFPLKVVSLTKKLLKDVPPRASRAEIIKKLWRRSAFCIIDNRTTTRRALRAALVNCGAGNIDTCADGGEFLKEYGGKDAKVYDVVVIGASGEIQKEDILALIRRVNFPSNLAIGIAVMAYADAAEVQKIVSGGFHGILLAPFSKHALERMITQLLSTNLLFEQHGDVMKTVLTKKTATLPGH